MNKKSTDASIVVLTGPSGAGKSTLAKMLEKRGWERLDGDVLAKSLYVPGSPILRAMARTFGGDILLPDRTLDTRRLGEIVFSNAKKRALLKRLVSEPFLCLLRAQMERLRAGRRPGVAEVAVYFDLGAPALGAPVVMVSAPLTVRVERLVAAGLSARQARARTTALRFGPRERMRADLVLDGRVAPQELLRQFDLRLATLAGRATALAAAP